MPSGVLGDHGAQMHPSWPEQPVRPRPRARIGATMSPSPRPAFPGAAAPERRTRSTAFRFFPVHRPRLRPRPLLRVQACLSARRRKGKCRFRKPPCPPGTPPAASMRLRAPRSGRRRRPIVLARHRLDPCPRRAMRTVSAGRASGRAGAGMAPRHGRGRQGPAVASRWRTTSWRHRAIARTGGWRSFVSKRRHGRDTRVRTRR